MTTPADAVALVSRALTALEGAELHLAELSSAAESGTSDSIALGAAVSAVRSAAAELHGILRRRGAAPT